jgi:hypothetical protein
MDWYWLGNLLYLIGSGGYVLCDSLYVSTHLPREVLDLLYVALACLFLIDAVIYWRLWYESTAPSSAFVDCSSASTAEFLNIVGSLGYTVTAVLGMSYFDGDPSVVRLSFILTTCCVIIYVIDSVLYMRAWHEPFRRSFDSQICCCQPCDDAEMWACLLNVLGSLLYLWGSILAVRLANETRSADGQGGQKGFNVLGAGGGGGGLGGGSDDDMLSTLAQALSLLYVNPDHTGMEPPTVKAYTPAEIRVRLRRILLLGNIVFFVDAVLYMVCWHRDKTSSAGPLRQQQQQRLLSVASGSNMEVSSSARYQPVSVH